MQLSGNTVLITGGTSGIGLALAKAFLAAGGTVIICARTAKRLDEVHQIHPQIYTRVCDVSEEKDRRELAKWLALNFPKLNVLINNAGIQRDIDFTHGVDDFISSENEMKINLEAPIILSGLFIPLLVKNSGAAIINVSSGLGFIPMARMPVHSASKAGLHAYSMALRHQLSSIGMQVFEIVSPAVDTELNPIGRAVRGDYKPDLSPQQFVVGIIDSLAKNVYEIGFGMTEGLIHASRADLDNSFNNMNGKAQVRCV